MEDPRIEELMDYIDAVDDSGEPTSIALIARRVSSYLDVIDELRKELDTHHEDVERFELQAANLSERLQERDSIGSTISEEAQNAAMRAAYTTTAGRGAQLRDDAAQKHKAFKQFETDYEEDMKRYKAAMRGLDTKQERLMEVRDQVARRLNIVDALLQRAEIEWPSYFFDENERIKAKKNSGNVSSVRRRSGRGGGRRRVIRRRRAS